MARVEWSRHSGDDVEFVIAIMLSRENTNAQRIRPSRGDKGIDILVPVDDGFDIYQIKSYTGEINSSRKRHITKSWERLREYIETSGLAVRRWYLTMPEDATTENLAWLNDLTEAAGFPCAWRGLNYVEALAAKYPDIIDYYFRDGKDRLEEKIRELMALMGMHTTTDTIPATLSEDRLTTLHDLVNSLDPHFYYDFAVDTVPEGSPPPAPDIANRPRLLAACLYGRGDRCITTYINARYEGAELDRPVPGEVSLDLTKHPDAREQLQAMFDYGVGFTSPPGTASGNFDLPGGYGGTFEGATLRFGEAHIPGVRPFRLRLRIVDEEGSELAIIFTDMEAATIGQTGRYVHSIGKEEHGVFTVETVLDKQEGTMRIGLAACNLTGTIPSKVRNGFLFISQFKPPNALQILPELGPAGPEIHPITESPEWANETNYLVDVFDALATIQDYTQIQIRTPDLTTTPTRTSKHWIRAAKLLRGERLVQSWSKVTAQLHPGAEERVADFELAALAIQQRLTVKVGETEIELGIVMCHMPMARLSCIWSDLETHEVSATYVPADSSEMTLYIPARGEAQ